MKKALSLCVYVNVIVMIFLSLYLFLIPAGMIVRDLRDPGLCSGQVPRFVFRWHQALTPKYERWANQRLEAGPARGLDDLGVSGTEWPLFGSVFYLWATEALQSAWENDPTISPRAPRDYAQGTIEVATALVVDPNQASWVKEYWGESYLAEGNLFYRMMLISAMTSYEKLMPPSYSQYRAALREQVESLAHELDASPHGVIDDYPGYCYPVDIVAAIAAIQRADSILGADHTAFVKRSIRGFQESRCHEDTGLPAYLVDARRGNALDVARGIGLSFMLIWAPELWPGTAREWYRKYERHFWQQGPWWAGFREFSSDIAVPWFQMNDPDAGPVFQGIGCAASAFGIPASKAQGCYDHTYTLACQALIAAWPLPNGTLLGPRFLSNLREAPYLGEAVMTFIFSFHAQNPQAPKMLLKDLPRSVYLGLGVYIAMGLYGLGAAWFTLGRWRRHKPSIHYPLPKSQLILWGILILFSIWLILWHHIHLGLVPILAALLLPRYHTRRALPLKHHLKEK